MAKLLAIDGKLRTVGGKLVTDANGALCCCDGDTGCTEWQRMGQCPTGFPKRYICHDPRSKCTNGTNASGGSKTVVWEGECWQLENFFRADPPQSARVPPGTVFDCFRDCAACGECNDCCDDGPCGWANPGNSRLLTVSGQATGTMRNSVLCSGNCTTRDSTVAALVPPSQESFICGSCNVATVAGGDITDDGLHYDCNGLDGSNSYQYSTQYRVRLNQPDVLDFTGFDASDGASSIAAPYALVQADLLMGNAILGGNVSALLVAAVNLETGVWAAALQFSGIDPDTVEAAFSVTAGAGCSSADIIASVDFTVTEDEGNNCAPGTPDRFSGSVSVTGTASAINPCPSGPDGGVDAPDAGEPRSPLDPRIASTLDLQARGGGCRGCGDGFTG